MFYETFYIHFNSAWWWRTTYQCGNYYGNRKHLKELDECYALGYENLRTKTKNKKSFWRNINFKFPFDYLKYNRILNLFKSTFIVRDFARLILVIRISRCWSTHYYPYFKNYVHGGTVCVTVSCACAY